MRIFFIQLCLLSFPYLLWGQGVSMSPSRLFFTGNPGETITQTVRLGNNSATEVIMSVGYKDWIRDENGNKIYMEPGSQDHSNARWLTTGLSTIRIPAKEHTEVQVTMQIPADISNDQVTNSMLFFTQVPSQSDVSTANTGIGIITLFEFGLHVYHTPPANQVTSLEIINMVDEGGSENSERKVVITILNDGNTIADASVEFELTNTDTGSEIEMDPRSISMFPGAKQNVTFTISDDISGNYLGVAIVKMAGLNDLRIGEKSFKF